MRSDYLFNRCYKISKAGAIFSILIGFLVIGGWIFNLSMIKSILPNWATMKPTTAIGFILIGLSIICIQTREKNPQFKSFCVLIFSIIVVVFSGMTLLEWFLKLELGIDHLFFEEKQSEVTPYPGRMSIITAINFLLSGFALLYSQLFKNSYQWPSHLLALTIFLISLDALFGFTYGVASFFDSIIYVQLSLHTSIAFIVFSISLLFLDPRSGFSKVFILDGIGSKLAWNLLPSILVLPPVIGLFALAGENLNLYDSDFRIVVVVMSFLAIFTILIWRTSYAMHNYERQNRVLNKKMWKIHLKNQELIDTKQHLEEVSNRDELTGLSNRAHFYGLLEHAMMRAKRYKNLVGLFFIDMDNFKKINDTLGHNIGDKLLINFSDRLKALLREIDSISRLGGDEFTVIIEDPIEIGNITVVANRIINSLVEPFNIEGNIIHVTVSVGVSIFPKDGDDIETLIKNADIAMYQAKRSGKNKYQFYQDDFNL